MSLRALAKFFWQTWRSIISFFLSFVVLALGVWFTPDFVTAFMLSVGQFKYFVAGLGQEILPGQVSAAFVALVPDTAIGLAGFTLFTRVIVLTLLLWVVAQIRGKEPGD